MLSLEEIIKVTGGIQAGIDDTSLVPSGVSTDSRSIAQGELFVAIKGPTYDGHDFVQDSLEKGAVAAIVSNEVPIPRTIKVKNTLTALGDLAQEWRMRLDIPLILISGTNGKTTVKNICRTLLGVRLNTYANSGNLNNLIGLPLSLVQITEQHEAAVLEAGISAKGELARLCEIAKPTVGLLTNIGPGHLEELGTLENVFEAKWELARYIGDSGGTLYINADFMEFTKRARKERIRFRTFGVKEDAETKPENIRYGIEGTRFVLGGYEFHLPLLGPANLSNAIASLAIAKGEFDIPLAEAAVVMDELKPERWRLEHRLVGDTHIIADCYNANPVSMKEALELLTLFPAPRIAVLGAMLELGSESARYHHDVLELARDTADLVIVTGPHSQLYPYHEGVIFIPDKSKAAEELHKRLIPGATMLVKGSRGCALEDIISELWGTA